MATVTSQDGTAISYDRLGRGRAVILVGGGLDDGAENAPLASELAQWFTVFNYARRGRGQSGDTQPYAVEREIEDIAALIAEAGGRANLYGVSSGGIFALEAAASGLPVDRIGLYDVPYDPSDGAGERFEDYRRQLAVTLADGRRGDAVALFMRLAGSSDSEVDGARNSAYWPPLEAIAHTLAYDAALYGAPPVERLAAISQPTLVMTGGHGTFFAPAADAIAESLPNAERLVVEAQGHVADPKVVAPILRRFFSA